MPNIFDANFDTSADGEFFWHATTVKNVLGMIQYDGGGLRAIGDGQLGAGFYLTGTRSDYQKAMARRSRADDAAPLFLFYVRVRGFYQLTPRFLAGWDTSSVAGADFSAVSWYRDGSGGVGMPEQGGFIPSATTGKKTIFKYGEYRQEPMLGTQIADKPAKERLSLIELLWGFARTNAFPSYKDVEQYGQIAAMVPMLGARKTLTRLLLELALKSEASLANSAIVGVKVFSPTTSAVPLKFDYDRKSYDLTSAVVDQAALKSDENPLNFHDEVWLDLDEMLRLMA